VRLVLHHSINSRISGQDQDYDVFDGHDEVGRIYRVTDHPDSPWFWALSPQLTGLRSYGHADSLYEAQVAFGAKYEAWKGVPILAPPRTNLGGVPFPMLKDGWRLLELLAARPSGSSEALLLARGFSRAVILDLLRDGCVTSPPPERTFAPGRPVHLTRVQITEAGRRALADQRPRGDIAFLLENEQRCCFAPPPEAARPDRALHTDPCAAPAHRATVGARDKHDEYGLIGRKQARKAVSACSRGAAMTGPTDTRQHRTWQTSDGRKQRCSRPPPRPPRQRQAVKRIKPSSQLSAPAENPSKN